MNYFIAFCLAIFSAHTASADSYGCAKMTVKDGWFRKYEHLGNTWGANTKKHGLLSSSIGSSVEKTTSMFDPGVTTGNLMSTAQYSSSWGECAMVDYHTTQIIRDEYIEQNLEGIKKEIALGGGHLIDSLAFVSGCKAADKAVWTRSLQKNTADFYDAQTTQVFTKKLESVIRTTQHLQSSCSLI